jgi:speckle-type POZ protein
MTVQGSHDDFVAFNEITTAPMEFRRPLDRFPPLYIGVGRATESLGEFDTCSWAVECNITVFRDPPAAGGEGAVAVPSFNLTQHLGELLESQAGADVTFAVSSESVAAGPPPRIGACWPRGPRPSRPSSLAGWWMRRRRPPDA